MSGNHRNMYKLYNEVRNAIVTEPICLHIPGESGTGTIYRTVTKQGVIVSDWRYCFGSDFYVGSVCDSKYIQMIYCIGEGISWNREQVKDAFYMQKGEICVHIGRDKSESCCYPKHCDYHFQSLHFPEHYFNAILNEYFNPREIRAIQERIYDSSNIEISPDMERRLRELNRTTPYHGGLNMLYLESKVLELLSVYLSEVLELSRQVEAQSSLTATDVQAVTEARRMIDCWPEEAPCCEELARRVKLSTSKLVKGFSTMYGIPVHAYIIERRLEKAALLLEENKWNIGQIALMVGYSNAGHFSAAFRKKFGVSPKKYQNRA